MSKVKRARTFLAVLVVGATLSAFARADQTDVCIDADAQVQRLRAQNALVAATDAARMCAAASCPAVVREECSAWITELETKVPTVIVVAFDAAGAAVADARLFVDDRLALTGLDGAPTRLDPGTHVLRIERAGDSPLTQHVALQPGDRDVRVVFRFPPRAPKTIAETPPPIVAPTTARPVPASTWIFGGVALAGFATFAVTGLVGKSRYDALSASCPSCSQDDRDAAKTMLRVADVSLAVGVVSGALATVLFVTRPEVVIAPSPHGAIAMFSGEF